MSNNFALMLRLRGDVSDEQFYAALRQVRVRHPALASATTESGAPYPVSARSGCSDTDWIETAQQALRQSFPNGSGPFARFELLRRAGSFDLVAAFDHGVCDGMSGVFVLRDLLQALADPQATLVPVPAPPRTGELIPPAAMTDRGLRARVAYATMQLRARILLARLFRRKAAGPAAVRPAGSGELPPERRYNILPTQLTATQTTALLARCKQEGVSVHAAICAAWLLAETGRRGARAGNISSPVNLRSFLSQRVGETSGVFLSIVETRLECAPGQDVWSLARRFKQKFSRELRPERLFFKPLLYAQVFSQLPAAERGLAVEILFNGPVDYDFSITNLGRLPIPERSGGLRAEAFYGPLVNSSESERTVGISTLGAQMSITYLSRQSRSDPEQAKELLERAVALLAGSSS